VREKANKGHAITFEIGMQTVVQSIVLVISYQVVLCNRCRRFCYKGGTVKSTGAQNPGCLERANQLPSLLLPVSDINRIAAGYGAAA